MNDVKNDVKVALRRTSRSIALLLVVMALALAAVGAPVAGAQGRLKVVASFSVLGDFVQNVGGDLVDVAVLVPAGGDPHTFEPSPADSIALNEAALVFEIGLEFETWLDNLYAASGSRAVRVAVSEGIAGLPFEGHDHEHADHDDHDHDDGHGGYMEGEAMIAARLIVNDFESGAVRIVDLRSNEVLATFDLTARASLYQSPSGRYAFAIQTNGNVTNVIDSGVSRVPHDEHFHTVFGSPSLLDFVLESQTPIHFVAHHDQIAIFNDGTGTAVVFTEEHLFDSSVEMVTLSTARPHHGVAVPMGDVVLISSPNMDDLNSSLPIGVDVMTLDSEIVQSFPECPGLHGEASYSHEGVAFGCSDGILLVMREGDGFTSRKLAYPSANPDLRTGTLYGAEGAPFVIGNYGPNALVRIDPAAGTVEAIEAPTRIWRFGLHGEDMSRAVALTVDGNLHVIDIASGAIEGSVQVVDPFLPPARGRPAARPVFVVNGHIAYVSEPLPGDIAAVNLETLEVAEQRVVVGGKPSAMAVFGMMAESEGGAPDHGHEDDHEHGHHHGEIDPHVWHDVQNAIHMVGVIRDALAEADPGNAEAYRANAEAYIAELEALDAFILEQVAAVPEANRILFTSHEAFGYFGARYGFAVDSVLGITTESADPSASQIAAIIDAIRESGVPAIFAENAVNPRLIEQIAREAGVRLGTDLYDVLGEPGTPGDTYIGMMRHNASAIAEGLR
jgi:ABC-type Zn uptake system ZnuABC Zn-binding protein ZnuA